MPDTPDADLEVFDSDAPDPPVGRDFERLLDYLKSARGFDFSGYKRASLVRRIQKRMQMVAVTEYADYMDFLEVHPDEFGELFNVILINVTSFFRDPGVWDLVAQEIVPRLLAAKGDAGAIRVWSAGCSSGQEAYTLAMVLAEALGMDAFRRRVKIYGTDMDEDALAQARQAVYSAREVASVPAPLREKYFETAGGRYAFHKDLRRAVIFGRHDLLQDAPISRIDLLVCRNALMYFNAGAQGRILARLHYALSEGGALILGKAEMLFAHAELFMPVDLKRRVFRKVPRIGMRDRLLLMAQAGTEQEAAHMADHVRMREAAFEGAPVAQVIADRAGQVALINEQARLLFHLDVQDVGRPLRDLEVSYRPLEIRSLIDQAYADRRPIAVKNVAWPSTLGERRFFDVGVTPVHDNGSAALGAVITFTDVTRYKHLQEELEESNRELETAYEELQSTNEELETTNEELQSTVEELETTNEELQSTNEELETRNEELQSTNEELQAINGEVDRRSVELNQVNAFLSSILSSLRGGVVVLDENLQVQVWNHQAEDLWGLRADEVQGRPFLHLDIGLPVERLRNPIRDSLSGLSPSEEILLPSRNRRGQEFVCRVICTPMTGTADEARGVILLMEAQGT